MKPVKFPRCGVKMRGSGGRCLVWPAAASLPVRLASAAVRRDGSARALEEFPCWPMPVADCE